jgi:hypothetical protein
MVQSKAFVPEAIDLILNEDTCFDILFKVSLAPSPVKLLLIGHNS